MTEPAILKLKWRVGQRRVIGYQLVTHHGGDPIHVVPQNWKGNYLADMTPLLVRARMRGDLTSAYVRIHYWTPSFKRQTYVDECVFHLKRGIT